MGKSVDTARELAIAKLEYEVAQAAADEKKKRYEALRAQLVSEMVMDNMPKFELSLEHAPSFSFRLETKTRWSPVVDNKDILYEKLREDAPELFTVSAASLTKFIDELYLSNEEKLPPKYEGLVKSYEDTHVVVRQLKK